MSHVCFIFPEYLKVTLFASFILRDPFSLVIRRVKIIDTYDVFKLATINHRLSVGTLKGVLQTTRNKILQLDLI